MGSLIRFLLIVCAAVVLPQSGFCCLIIQEPTRDVLSEMELMERVAELQRDLVSPEISRRDSAEKELVRLGIRVLDYMEPATSKTPSDAVERLNRIRIELEKIAVATVTKASTVTLNGTMTVREALKRIRQQTQNDVAAPEETPDLFLDREIELKLENAQFWIALTEIMKRGELMIDPYAGMRGQLRVSPTRVARIRAANAQIQLETNDTDSDTYDPPKDISGIFELVVIRVNASRNLANPSLNYCKIRVRIRWEPRVTPISIDLPTSSLKAIDEFDNVVQINNPNAVLSGTVQPEIPELDFSIPIALVDRKIEVIKSLDATIDAVIPGRMETFRFKKIGRLSQGTQQTKAGATVTFDGIQKNEDLFGVTVRLRFDEEHNALESHQNWVYNNPVHLQDEAGETFEALAYEGVTQTNNEVAIRYYFERDPKDMTLFYKTPALIVEIPVKVSLKNIPLP